MGILKKLIFGVTGSIPVRSTKARAFKEKQVLILNCNFRSYLSINLDAHLIALEI